MIGSGAKFLRESNRSEKTKPSMQPTDDGWLMPEFRENCEKFPPEELMKYYGKVVAWCRDGARILARATTRTSCSIGSERWDCSV
jgi:hypothetical protein